MNKSTDRIPFEKKVWLSSPTMHGEELEYVTEAYNTNWMSTVGANINEVEKIAAEKAGVKYAVALSCCTAALHLCVKLAGEKLYGNLVLPALKHDYIGIFLAWFNVFFMHGLYSGSVLIQNGINASAPFLHIAKDSPAKANISIRIYKNLHIHKVAQLFIVQN